MDSSPASVHQPEIVADIRDYTANLVPFSRHSRSRTVSCPIVSEFEKEFQVMETVLECCLRFNLHLSLYRKQNATSTIRTEISDIQRQADDVLKLPYDRAVTEIKTERTASFSKKMQIRYMETIFWHFIEEAAKHVNPEDCPVPKGPLDGFTRQEKRAHRDFLWHAGYGTGLNNARHYRLLWKNLFKLRQGGVEKILLYRTKEFDSFCESFSSNTSPALLDTVIWWEEKYGPQISLLERRIANATEKGLSEDPLLSQPDIAKMLKVSRKAWNNDTNSWHSEQEAESFQEAHRMLLAGLFSPGGLQDMPTKIGEERERCLFIVLKPKGVEEIMVCPIITIEPGDFLGIFSGELRYSTNFDEAHGVPGPQANFWLDYSRVTGMLNLARVSLPDEVANFEVNVEFSTMVLGGFLE
ncbi:hypothetical protein BBO_09418 [Beauveria brongniartii RCEF 3172]|uniref:Uncharacterized protein n=1 Tax=Beauveria brongniartii RCEF 3172 TaxID=1081107 RepID=A0A166VPX1_9HYPO|nr:hypothetical protein BBO_09418 [Beauveria brongniartii RCEF 3172]